MSDNTTYAEDFLASLDLENFSPPDGFNPGGAHHNTSQKTFTSTRTARYRGRKIKVKTTYRIEIDDVPVTQHTMVMDDGRVHCHGLPNYSFLSAIDLARSMIDTARYVSVPEDEIGAVDDTHDHDGTPPDHSNHGGQN